jgi:hypothetical protein
MKDMIAHWNGFESIFINGSLLTIERRQLIQSVFHAADLIDWAETQSNSIPVPVLRSVLLYCLALNICSSEEIVDACESDPRAKYLCANHSFEWQVVHDFRRRNLEQVRDALAILFQSLCSSVADPQLRGIARAEAEQRIRRAVQADSTVLDL